jgi:hypothetical protein
MNYNGNNNTKIMLTVPIIEVSKFSAKCVSASEVFVQRHLRLYKTTLAAEAHLTEGQLLPAEDTVNMGKSLIRRTGTRRPTISEEEEQWIKPR